MKNSELAGLLFVAVSSLAVVGWATATRTGIADANFVRNKAVPSLIAEANADTIDHASSNGSAATTAKEQAPIYIDLGARF